MQSNYLILCRPLLLLPSIFPSIRVFSSELTLHIRWPKYWNFSINPSNECSELISFRIDWFDFIAVQGTLKSVCVSCSVMSDSVTPLTVASQFPLFMEFFQARILESVAILFSRGSSRLRDQTQVSCIAGRFFFFHLSHQRSLNNMNKHQ